MRVVCRKWVVSMGTEIPGMAAGLDGIEFGREAVEGVFVLFAKFGGALVEAGLVGFFHF